MSASATAARKVARLLGDLETYVSGQSDVIIDYRPPADAMSRFRRRLLRARYNGCCIGE
jgi:hypothetical protein